MIPFGSRLEKEESNRKKITLYYFTVKAVPQSEERVGQDEQLTAQSVPHS